MSILSAVMVGAGIIKGVSGLFGNSSSNNQAKEAYEQQKKYLQGQYNFNLGVLQDNLINNTLVNYSSVAGIMYGVTEQYIKNKNEALMNTQSYFSGGTSYNSNRQDTLNNLTLDYTNAINDYISLREYNEQWLIKQFDIDVANLTSKFNYQNYQLDKNLYLTNQKSNTNAFGNILDTALNVFNGLQGGGSTSEGFGLGNLFGGTKSNNESFTAISEENWLG